MTLRHASTLLAGALALSLAAAPALAKRAPEAGFPARAGKSRLVFECGPDKAIQMRIWNPVRGWLADRPTVVRLGEKSFRTEVDGATDSFLLSDVPLPKSGVSDDLLAAAKASEELVVAGPSAEQIPGPQRSFPLRGARAKIGRVEKACGRSPVAGLADPKVVSSHAPSGT